MNSNLEEAIRVARKEFSRGDPGVMAARSGATYDAPAGRFNLSFLGETVHVSFPQGAVTARAREMETVEEILLLHYLAQSIGGELQGRLLPFRELPGGAIYQAPFQQRAIQPLLRTFGKRPQDLLAAGRFLGGQPDTLGDCSVRVQALPMVPVVLVIWEGDEEFPPSGNVLFDASAPRFLPTEDFAQMSALLARRICRAGGG